MVNLAYYKWNIKKEKMLHYLNIYKVHSFGISVFLLFFFEEQHSKNLRVR